MQCASTNENVKLYLMDGQIRDQRLHNAAEAGGV
jgi:hypothetical protein